MLLIILLVVIFWAVLPGLLTGWMLREHGSGFGLGLFIGAVFGPLGTLLVLVFILLAGRRPGRGRDSGRTRGFRAFYIVPYVGRLHFSTVWTLAGVATFLCLWMIGGLGYEFYVAHRQPSGTGGERAEKPAPGRTQQEARADAPRNAPQAAPKDDAPAQGDANAGPQAPLLSSLTTRAGQVAQAAVSNENSLPQTGLSSSANNSLSGVAPPPSAGAANVAAAPQPSATNSPQPAPAQQPAPSREAAVSEVARGLGAAGHRVHVAVSGDAQTATISVSGATLTRAAGNQLLGNPRTRQTLRASGIRIVVMINGQESWTYML